RRAAVRKPAFWVLASMPASLGHPGQRSVLDDRQLPTELTRHCVPTQQPSTRLPWLGKANDRQITGRLSRVTDTVVEEGADCQDRPLDRVYPGDLYRCAGDQDQRQGGRQPAGLPGQR